MDYSSTYEEMVSNMSPATVAVSWIVTIICIIAMWKMFQKAGAPGWAAIVPFYNVYVLFKLTWGSGWKFLLLLIPVANIVISIMTVFKLAKAYGKGTGFGFGLLFLAPIFYCILGFGKAQYVGVPQ